MLNHLVDKSSVNKITREDFMANLTTAFSLGYPNVAKEPSS